MMALKLVCLGTFPIFIFSVVQKKILNSKSLPPTPSTKKENRKTKSKDPYHFILNMQNGKVGGNGRAKVYKWNWAKGCFQTCIITFGCIALEIVFPFGVVLWTIVNATIAFGYTPKVNNTGLPRPP